MIFPVPIASDQLLAVALEEADLAAVFEDAQADAVGLLRDRVPDGDVGHVDRHFLGDDAARLILHRVGLGVLLDLVDAVHEHVPVVHDLRHVAALALVTARDDDDVVAFLDLAHFYAPAILSIRLQHFRRERHDLHEPLVAQLARDRSEDARADRLELGGEQHGGIGVEADQRAVRAAHALARAHDHRVVDLDLLHASSRRRVLDRDLDHVTDVRVPALAAAQHLDTHHRTCAGVIGDVQHRLHLDHCSLSNLTRHPSKTPCRPLFGKFEGLGQSMLLAASFGPRTGRLHRGTLKTVSAAGENSNYGRKWRIRQLPAPFPIRPAAPFSGWSRRAQPLSWATFAWRETLPDALPLTR